MGRKKTIERPHSTAYKPLSFEKQIEGAAVNKRSNLGWIKWGQKNDYPNRLLNLYANSPTHSACIRFGVQSIVGLGIDYDAMLIDGSQMVPNPMYSWDELIRSISMDYMLYGSYCIEVIRNRDGQTFSFYHMPMEKVRMTEYDENGDITSYYVSSDWTTSEIPQLVDAFDMRDADKIKPGKPYLYVYRPYDPVTRYYTSPLYLSGIKAIQSEIEFCNYDLKSAINSFVPSGMLVLNEVATDEERQGVINNVQQMFTGTENANSIMITFRDNPDSPIPQFVPFSTSKENFNLFDSSNQRNIVRILSAHQIPNASLVGLPDIGSTGFASDAQKLEIAYNLYNQLIGNTNRRNIVGSLNHMFAMNGIDTEIVIKPLTFLDGDRPMPESNEETQTEDNDNQ